MKEELKCGILCSKSLVKVASGVWVMGTYILVLCGVAVLSTHLARKDAGDVGPVAVLCVFLTTLVNWCAYGIASDAQTKEANGADAGGCR